MKINISRDEFEIIASRSSGAGGQNVNKVNSKITLRWNVFITVSINEDVKYRFIKEFKNKINEEGIVTIISSEHRTQKLNLEVAIHKLYKMIELVFYPPKIRKKTKPTKASKLKRLSSKKKHSDIKKSRSEKY
jgi:ribosome-associated protein